MERNENIRSAATAEPHATARKRGAVPQGSAWALVTGAGSGIGRCYALRLAALGYNLAIAGDRAEPLDGVREELAAAGCPRVQVVVTDLARIEAAQELYDGLCGAGIAPDVVVNNAGIFSFCDVLSTPSERIERIVLLHDMTTTQLCRLYAAQMIARGVRGHILNMSSYSQWMPFPGLALYGASKAYLRTFSVAFAKEVADRGIRVTASCPAGVATDLYGLTPRWQRIGQRLGVLISADSCARRGLHALWRGRRSVVPDWWNRAWIPLCKLLPLRAIRPLRRFTMRFQK
ncbi:SDR family NAD(P)-dependent oxidoreductase [Alistipes sp.]|uniref:SDR family NAD(P)-dependent oxidoreductase n=1 Tax=Alistipes sp. TaxID=1872444 RepID=UPI003AF07571